jgi:NAD(P)-dependent dehydrogenase (short-subunit alcohol dehydrogenase family)
MALEQFKLDGQVAIVTGAGRGVGCGIAKVLAEAGAIVVGTARGDSELKETIAQIEKAGGKGLGLTGDATKRADNERIVKSTMERFGRIDILINNAGGADYAPFLEITDESFRHHFEWNTTSAFIMSQLVAPHMLRAGAGSIVNISSGAGRFGIRGLLAYSVAKGALNQLTKAMAQELAPKVRVNAIALGSFMTAALQKTLDMMPQAEATMKKLTPLHRFGDVADLGRLVVYLSTRDCYATNAIFDVDGGIEGTNSPISVADL